MSSRVTTIYKEKEADSSGDLGQSVSSFFGALEGIGESMIGLLKQFLQLPLSSPIMSAVIGILINDMLAHKIDWRNWQHQEDICLDCAGLIVNAVGSVTNAAGSLVGNLVNGFLLFTNLYQVFGFIQSNSSAAANHSGQNAGHAHALVWLPGVITNSANLQIAGIILTGFGTSEVGSILTDISQFTGLVKGAAPSSSVTTPSVTTLGVPIVSEKAAKQ